MNPCRYSRPARLHIAPVGAVNLIHLGKVVHVGEEDIDLDDIVDVGASLLEDSTEVLDTLMLRAALENANGVQMSGSSLPCGPERRRR